MGIFPSDSEEFLLTKHTQGLFRRNGIFPWPSGKQLWLNCWYWIPDIALIQKPRAASAARGFFSILCVISPGCFSCRRWRDTRSSSRRYPAAFPGSSERRSDGSDPDRRILFLPDESNPWSSGRKREPSRHHRRVPRPVYHYLARIPPLLKRRDESPKQTVIIFNKTI